ncbi:helicase-related protein [Thioalkalivibrio sp. ALE19]|uniref:helicase-related protein n=1 Tax=Thioalkalivibrio sp. ALE19 TaxID=1266909 RepID=UPI00048A7669|nr:helicase-related protein [Thioalkalivibrio sp. ALE19]
MPIDALHGDFAAALADGPVVVSAATGSGKSTRLPVWAREQGRVLVVEPRRVAATSLAHWVAGLLGGKPGREAGFAVRGEVRCDRDTQIVFATPGMALQWLAHHGLADFAVVVLDEFHERRWDTDLLYALLTETGRHRLVITSATIDGARLARDLGGTCLESPGRSWPVALEHLAADPQAMPHAKDLATRVAEGIRTALARTDGDVLAFLPGRGEIAAAARALKDEPVACIELHAGASAEAQRHALQPGQERRVILATNVAESSVTVPGVTAVVDSGLERRTGRRNGRTVLALQAIAADSAEQRRGRAGRTAPGLCLRLWGRNAPLAANTPPELQREDLTEPVLAAACCDRPARELAFPDPPREEALERAEDRLRAMHAIDADGRATEHGQRLFALPVDTALAHLVLAMPDAATAAFMADLAGALGRRRAVAVPPNDERERQEAVAALGRACDATLRVAAVRGHAPEGVHIRREERREALHLARQVRELAGLPARESQQEPQQEPESESLAATAPRALTAAVAAAPELAFVRRERRRFALGNGGEEAEIGRDSLLAEDAEAAVVFDSHSLPGKGTRDTRTIATVLAPLEPDALIDAGVATPAIADPEWSAEGLVVRRDWWHAGRVLRSDRTRPAGAAAREALAALILEDQLLAPAGSRLRDDLDAWALYLALGFEQGEVPDARDWLARRLQTLGVESDEDVVLLEPEDLAFEGVPEWKRERFDRRYPREVRLSGLHMRIHYNVARRTVTAEKIDGNRRDDPKRWELPAWQGWHVRFQRASRVVDVR